MFLVSSISSKNEQIHVAYVVVKTNSLVRFLEEFTAWQFAFEINWPLHCALGNFAAARQVCRLLQGYVISRTGTSSTGSHFDLSYICAKNYFTTLTSYSHNLDLF